MAARTIHSLSKHIFPAQRYLQTHLGLDAGTALHVVEDALLVHFRGGPKTLRHPRRYFFSTCRIHALRRLRGQRGSAQAVVEKRRTKAETKKREILIALQDEDKPKFFGRSASPREEVLELTLEEDVRGLGRAGDSGSCSPPGVRPGAEDTQAGGGAVPVHG